MNKYKKAQEFCLEVEKLSKKYNLPFFFLTDGASIMWEEKHNIDSKEDWLKD